jgi:multidrug efflux pump subunit AcrA (membrane-fusion protein)
MKSKVCIPAMLVLALLMAACGGVANTPTAIPTIVLGENASTPAANADLGGGVTASGIVVSDQLAEMAFELAGDVKQVNVAVGDQVETGQVLIQLDDTAQQIQLAQANLNLNELTSPSALAAAQLAVAQDQQDLYNEKVARNNLTAQNYNQDLIDNTHAGLIIAGEALKQAQEMYNDTPGNKDTDPEKARAYQKLYTTQQNYDHAEYLYNFYSGKPNQSKIDEEDAKVALATAKLAEDQTLVAALTGGDLPQDATGMGYAKLMQARLDLQTAQDNLEATHLVAPFAGEVASITVSVGDFISPGQVVLVISDVKHMHIETTDLSERDVPQVKLDQQVTISFIALNQDVNGKVEAISPLADTIGGDVVYKAIIILDEFPTNIRAGMSVDVFFQTSP